MAAPIPTAALRPNTTGSTVVDLRWISDGLIISFSWWRSMFDFPYFGFIPDYWRSLPPR
jgi:hypothetical protein